MSCKRTKKPGKAAGKVQSEDRRKRLEAEMKANLQKRKAQARARTSGTIH